MINCVLDFSRRKVYDENVTDGRYRNSHSFVQYFIASLTVFNHGEINGLMERKRYAVMTDK